MTPSYSGLCVKGSAESRPTSGTMPTDDASTATEQSEAAQIDHFIPWARHPDNGIHNLVYAHARCNNDKRAFLAAEDYIERILLRMFDASSASALAEIALKAGWESHPAATLAIARSTYLTLPAGYKLWQRVGEFAPVDLPRVRAILERRVALP